MVISQRGGNQHRATRRGFRQTIIAETALQLARFQAPIKIASGANCATTNGVVYAELNQFWQGSMRAVPSGAASAMHLLP